MPLLPSQVLLYFKIVILKKIIPNTRNPCLVVKFEYNFALINPLWSHWKSITSHCFWWYGSTTYSLPWFEYSYVKSRSFFLNDFCRFDACNNSANNYNITHNLNILVAPTCNFNIISYRVLSYKNKTKKKKSDVQKSIPHDADISRFYEDNLRDW